MIKEFLLVFGGYRWQKQDADAKLGAKSDELDGKFDIKKANSASTRVKVTGYCAG
jgi:hypothetical protein